MRSRNSRHRYRLTFRKDRAKISLPYWNRIIDAICARDPAAAQQALRDHAQNVKDSMLAVASAGEPFGGLRAIT